MKHAVTAVLVAATLAFAAKAGLDYPKDYRTWTHAKSMVIADKTHPLAGFHHVYVGPKAIDAYKKGAALPEGAEFAVAFYEVNDDKGTVTQGAMKMLAVMKKQAVAKETGGWSYGAFDPSGKAMELDVKKGCFDCHSAQKDKDFIFSQWQ
jgi:hypothetical protein